MRFTRILTKTLAFVVLFFIQTTAADKVAEAMNPFFDPSVLDEFKKSINYSQLVARLPQRSSLFIDWHQGLEQVVVQGKRWTRLKDTVPSIVGSHHGILSTNYVNDDGVYISVKAHVFSSGYQQSVFDYMLKLMASTSFPKVPFAHHANGPGDSYFAAPQIVDKKAESASYVLLGNVILVIDTADMALSVRDFTCEYVSTIQNKVKVEPKYLPQPFSASSSQKQLKTGDSLAIVFHAKQAEKIQTAIDADTIDGKFTLTEKTAAGIKLEAQRPGEHEITVRYLDVDTLYSNLVKLEIKVVP
ncbi:hypothetical protein SAMN02745866_01957 [Alteromonadaceae bacterium Bs31]|nr:hypothetical protein SAMN02745866_01957 [Alteromonadaceae bacterium Bs31]